MFLFSFFQDISNIPNITDWLQGIGTILGVPGAVAAFILLFKKDKEKGKKLDMITNVVIELSNQTKQFEYQTSLMKESNDILKEQVEVQNEALMNDKFYKEKMKEIEIKKSKNKYKPFFRSAGVINRGNNFEMRVRNFGETADIKSFKHLRGNMKLRLPKTPLNVDKNGTFVISGKYSESDEKLNESGLIEVKFEDTLGTIYNQKFNIIDGRLIVSDMFELND